MIPRRKSALRPDGEGDPVQQSRFVRVMPRDNHYVGTSNNS
jgi:hypothetical protein